MSNKIVAGGEAILAIKDLLGPLGIIDDPERMRPYLVSWRNGWEGQSPFIALPADTAQVAALLKICQRYQIPMVPQGGNSGLVGGSIPSQDGSQIVVNLSRMNKIRSFDPVGAVVIAEAGVILQTLQEEADKAGFLFPLSMASEGSAQIGGAISTNAGGTAVLRYGTMRDLTLGLEVVLPSGDILAGLQSLPKDNSGYNLNHYFIGAEGTLGIVTAAALRLFPRLNQTVTGLAALPDANSAMELLSRFRAQCGEHLSAFEILSLSALRLVVKNIPGMRFPFRPETPYYILVELGSASTAIPLRTLFENAMAQALEDGKILNAVIAESSAQASQFWALRENASEALRKEGRGLHFDISLPLAQIAGFLDGMEKCIKAVAPNILVAPFGHIGDGNIHYNMHVPENKDSLAFVSLKAQIQHLVYDEVTRLGGSISAEHGIGIERKAELKLYKSPVALKTMRAVKKALDPDGLMNPGKIFDEIDG